MRGRKLIPLNPQEMGGGQCSGPSPQARLCEAIPDISAHGVLLALYSRIHAYLISLGNKAKSRHEDYEDCSCVY